jgi:hypothetical protein
MQRLTGFLLLLLLTFSCKKESSSFIWERSFGNGNAYFITATPDSGIIACGEKSSKPFVVKFSADKHLAVEYTYPVEGLFSSAWSDTSGIIAAGSSHGKMLLAKIDGQGDKIWDTLISTGFYIDFTRLCYSGDGTFIAVASASADSAFNGASGLLFIRFDSAGNITGKKEVSEEWFSAAGDVAADGSGNIYIAVTARSSSMKPRAALAKYNIDFNKIWETDLYNNNAFNSGCNGIIYDNGGNLYVTGKTEVAQSEGTLENSFAASVTTSGTIIWKKYLEIFNSGARIRADNSGTLMLLNTNCFVIDLISNYQSEKDYSVNGLIRFFGACDSKNTDAYGSDFNFDHDGNIIAAGSLGGNFYIAVKSASQ